MVVAFTHYRGEDTGSGPMIKTDRLSDFSLFLFLLVWMSAFFHFLYLFFFFLSVFLSLSLSSLMHELLREGEGCVGVQGVTF